MCAHPCLTQNAGMVTPADLCHVVFSAVKPPHVPRDYKMLNGVILFSLTISVILAAILDTSHGAGSCLLNTCICSAYVVNCQDCANSRPHFTTSERLYIRYVKLRWDHVAWMREICDGFPNLEVVIVGYSQTMRSTPCPQLERCHHLKVNCL
jgi:hypothetical protein